MEQLHDGIVVGHDGSRASSEAVRWAAGVARRLDVPLHVIRAWSFTNAPRPESMSVGYVPPVDEFAEAVGRELGRPVPLYVYLEWEKDDGPAPPPRAVTAARDVAHRNPIGSRASDLSRRGFLRGTVVAAVARFGHRLTRVAGWGSSIALLLLGPAAVSDHRNGPAAASMA